jgi:putative transposase
VQSLADRLDKALKAFFSRKDQGVGFPRFKSHTQWSSIHLRQHKTDFRLNGRFIRVPAKLGGDMKIKLHRTLEGTPKTCHLVKRADQHWYALIACEVEPVRTAHTRDDSAIGIDVGLKVFLADSEGGTVENPRYYRTSQATVRRKQRLLSRRKKDSRNRRKAAQELAKTHLTIERQRRDFHFKTAKHYADRYRLIVVEDLAVSRMVHGNLAKSIYDAGWVAFLFILAFKAESAGGKVVKINPRYTTQNCSSCGEYVQKSLSVRTHICPGCGYVADRDVNAARNILRAGAQPLLHNVSQ